MAKDVNTNPTPRPVNTNVNPDPKPQVTPEAKPVTPSVKNNNEPKTPQTDTQTQSNTTEPKTGNLEVSQDPKKRLAILQAQNRNGILTLEQRAEMDTLQTQIDDEADGESKQSYDDNVRKEDPDKEGFKEMDVIAYMYEKWLIEGAEWCAGKAEKGLGGLYERARRKVLNNLEEKRYEDEAFAKTNTATNTKKTGSIAANKEQKAREEYKENIHQMKDIMISLNKGELFNEENKAKLEKLKGYLNVENDENGRNALENLKAMCDEVKEHKKNEGKDGYNKEEASKSQLNLSKASQNLFTTLSRNAEFDFAVEMTSIKMTEAKLYDSIAKDPDGLGKDVDLSKKFDTMQKGSKETLEQATINDRVTFLNAKRDTPNMGAYGSYIPNPISKGDIETFRDIAENAAVFGKKAVLNKNAREFDRVPLENKDLNKLNNMINLKLQENEAGIREQTPRTDENTPTSATDENEPVTNTEENAPVTPTPVVNEPVIAEPIIDTVKDEADPNKKEDLREAVEPTPKLVISQDRLSENEHKQENLNSDLHRLRENPQYIRAGNLRQAIEQKRALREMSQSQSQDKFKGLKLDTRGQQNG